MLGSGQKEKKHKEKDQPSTVSLKKKNVGQPLGGMWDVQEAGCTLG